MPVDVVSEIEIEIDRPRSEVAAYASDPDNATSWYKNIDSVEWRSAPLLAIGSQFEFVAQFLGSQLTYTYEVVEHVPGERFVMRTAQGPFPMETTYSWEDTPSGGTRMVLRNTGEPKKFGKLAARVTATAIRRANKKDLRLLKKILESS